MNHKSNNNFVRVPANNLKTMKTNVSTIYAVPSSNTNQSQYSLKDLAKQRLRSRFDVSNISSFDETVKIRKSCHLIEQVTSEFFCDCAMGSKARLCNHTVGLMFKTNIIEIDSDVRSKPLGQKRKRGRPKKLPSCLARSPEQPVRSVLTAATSPDVSLLSSTIMVGQSVSPPNTTAILSPISVMSVQKKRVRDFESQVDLDSPPALPPAKQISRQKAQITFCESPDNIVSKYKEKILDQIKNIFSFLSS